VVRPRPIAAEDDEAAADLDRTRGARRAGARRRPPAVSSDVQGDAADALQIVCRHLPHFALPYAGERCGAGLAAFILRYRWSDAPVCGAARRQGDADRCRDESDEKISGEHDNLPDANPSCGSAPAFVESKRAAITGKFRWRARGKFSMSRVISTRTWRA